MRITRSISKHQTIEGQSNASNASSVDANNNDNISHYKGTTNVLDVQAKKTINADTALTNDQSEIEIEPSIDVEHRQSHTYVEEVDVTHLNQSIELL